MSSGIISRGIDGIKTLMKLIDVIQQAYIRHARIGPIGSHRYLLELMQG